MLVFAFLCAMNQAKALTLDETLEFYINLVEEKITKFDILEKKTMKKDLTKSNLKEVNEHALASGVDEENCTRVRSDISLS